MSERIPGSMRPHHNDTISLQSSFKDNSVILEVCRNSIFYGKQWSYIVNVQRNYVNRILYTKYLKKFNNGKSCFCSHILRNILSVRL